MCWIKHGIKLGLVISLVGGCATMKDNEDVLDANAGAYEAQDAVKQTQEQGRHVEKQGKKQFKQLAGSRKVKWQQFQAKMFGLEQSTQFLSAQIPELQASGTSVVESQKTDLLERIQQLSADFTQLKQQTAASNEVAVEHQQKAAQLESEAAQLEEMLPPL
ncbi:MAG: hypothetical protein DRR19_16890 [Candidatus Parabeggiatoa sp. nov. 1]|nr:MAG: hypothetical protein DRR19_16890 [Gammaproteobacteria bacterium]